MKYVNNISLAKAEFCYLNNRGSYSTIPPLQYTHQDEINQIYFLSYKNEHKFKNKTKTNRERK